MTAPIAALAGVNVDYKSRRDRVHALTAVDLEIAPGETLGVVGESGCGKSTLARALVGLQRPSAGTIRLHGADLATLRGRDRRRHIGRTVGMVFQDPATSLNRRMPVAQLVRDPLDVHRWQTPPQRADRVRDLLSLVGLPSSAQDALPGQLSGGQRQRVAIARALALDPALLVADEPTSALDVSVRAQILNLLLDLKDRLGLAMVFVSHDVTTVRRIADRIVTMYLGRIVEEMPSTVLDRPRHPYTTALLSATPSLLRPDEPIVLEGPLPSATNPPSGCPFRTRCWQATDACGRAMPDVTTEPGNPTHRYRCYHPITTPQERT
jgi:peptide/nickel transport system ATP-binding protein